MRIRSRFAAMAFAVVGLCGAAMVAVSASGCGSAANFVPVKQVATPTPVPPASASPTMGDNYLASILPARWDKSTVTFAIEGAGSSIPFIDPEGVTRRGAELWNPALVGLVQVVSVTGSDKPPNIRIRYVKPGTLGTLSDGSGNGVIGRTSVTVSGAGIVQSATVEIDRSLPPGLMGKVATHEVGHALGCRGHSPGDGDVMYYRASGEDVITARDRNTFRALYGEGNKPPGRAAEGNFTLVVCEFRKEAGD